MNLSSFTALQTTGTLLLIKVSFIAVLILFELFVLVLHKQIRSMNTIVTQPDMFPYLQTFAVFLEIALGVLIVLTLVIL